MQIVVATSISDAFQVAVDLIQGWAVDNPALIWFRGVKDSRLSLQPGAYWRKDYTELNPLIDLVQEGNTFASVGTLEDWDTYYLAQHHGIPTRLLDWTESFAAALFFAFDGWDGKTTPCIWILQPTQMTNVFLGWEGVLAPEGIPEMKAWLPVQIAKKIHVVTQDKDGYTYDNRWPIPIYPKKTNRRITAQQGTFTLHGRHSEPIDKLIVQTGRSLDNVVAKLELKRFKNTSVLRDLGLLGIRRSAVYPDIDNFVLQLKDYYKW